jgi:hypothetical protein
MSIAANALSDREAGQSMRVQTYAKIAGVLFLLSMIGGGFGEFYIPSTIVVSGDATATANNIRASGLFFRFGFAAYLLEAVCDIALTWIFYVLLRPVHRNLALLMAFFGLVATAVFAGAELFYFAASFILAGNGLTSFSSDQVDALALLSLRYYAYGAGIFMVFYGIGAILRGYLIFRSDFLPRALGVLLMIAGAGFVIKNLTLVLTPAYSSDLFVAPMFLAGLSLTAWFLVKGVDVPRWRARAEAAESPLRS